MHISWLGNTAIKIQAKPLNDDVNIYIDPYKSEKGTMPRSITPDVAIYTRGEDDSITLSGAPFVLATPGEIDIKGVLVTAVEGHDATSAMIRIDAEQISVGHLGLTNLPLTARQEEVLSGVDILCIPVGHPEGFSLETALKIISELEPKVIIPTAFKSDVDPQAQTPDAFIKEMGMSGKVTAEKKVILKKKDLPQEDTQLVLLVKE